MPLSNATAAAVAATAAAPPTAPDPWDDAGCDALIDELSALRRLLQAEASAAVPALAALSPVQRASALNLAHYLALRRGDLRPLQDRLAALGLSSLGRAETHVLASVDKVLGILHRLAGRPWRVPDDEPVGAHSGPQRLASQALALLGGGSPDRSARIMVTLPAAAASDDALVNALVDGGMDVARINCAHDDAATWAAMAGRVRRAARRAGRDLRVLMDLGGPKLRTGDAPPAPPVLKLRPQRDAFGRVTAPARLGLRAGGSARAVPDVDACIGVDPAWLQALRPGDRIDLVDARGARRRLTVVDRVRGGVRAATEHTSYLAADTVLRRRAGADATGSAGSAGSAGSPDGDDDRPLSPVLDLPARAGGLRLQRGDRLRLLRRGPAREAEPAGDGRRARPAAIACTLPEALDAVRPGEPVWFDDGRIGGRVTRRLKDAVEVEIVHAADGGALLRADKGINLPETRLDLPALTAQDRDDLASVVLNADIVGLSFAQSADDVRALQDELARRGRADLPLLLKVETRRGFEALPAMLVAAMRRPVYGVMIARGDLAVECGYERLAEIQEEILWACAAAHAPVVWATQVLESMARTGLPSRAEVTDAAMGERAECVMLNKGPHIAEALHALADILGRMQGHQAKKRALLRALRAWPAPDAG